MRMIERPVSTVILPLTLALSVLAGCRFQLAKVDPAGTDDASLSGALTGVPSYATIRKLVLEPECLTCHGTKEPILLSYEQVRAQLANIEDTTLIEKSMPPSAALSPLRARLLQNWIRAGAPLEGRDLTGADSPAGPTTPGIVRPVTFQQAWDKVIYPSCAKSCHAPDNTEGASVISNYAEWMSSKETSFYSVFIDQSMPKPRPGVTPLTQEQKDILSLWFADGMQP